MSILGALYSAVSGLTATSNGLGIISDNISNSNTVGYKETGTNFSTLVTQSSGATTLYSPGGVSSSPVYNIDQQGVMQSTNSPTDIALSGHGFFVVNVSPGGASSGGAFTFTRAGNFTQNAVGDLVNGAGFYLQGQKLTPAQALAIANGNTQQLTATSLNSLQTVNVTGIGGTASATANVTLSANLPASDTPASTARSMTVPIFDSQGIEHDMTLNFSKVAPVSSSQNFTEAGAIAQGDSFHVVYNGVNYTTPPLTAAAPTLTDIANAINGQFSASVLKVGGGAPQAGDIFTATVNGTAFTTSALSGAGPFTSQSVVNSLNATLGEFNVPISGTLAQGDQFTVTVDGTSYGPTAGLGPATPAMSDVASDLNAVLPANLRAVVNSGGTGVDIQNTTGFSSSVSMAVNTGAETIGTVTQNSTFSAALDANNNITIADSTGAATAASLVLAAGTGTETYQTQASTNTFSASVAGGNLQILDSAGQVVTAPAVTATVGAETFTAALPTSGTPVNRWAVSATFPNSGTTNALIAAGEQYVQFNTDGSLNLAQSTFATPNALSIVWDPSVSGGASPQTLTFDIGTNAQTNGLSQLGNTFSVGTINQDGVKFGNFTGVTVDANGIVTANFNNGLHQAIFILPIATFANPDGLLPQTGDTYQQSAASGSVLLNEAGTGAAGTVAPSQLENSTVDIATEFSRLIIMQNAYQANSKVITVSDQMLQSLLNIQTG
jgi:flagellar hook protein FlgE